MTRKIVPADNTDPARPGLAFMIATYDPLDHLIKYNKTSLVEEIGLICLHIRPIHLYKCGNMPKNHNKKE